MRSQPETVNHNFLDVPGPEQAWFAGLMAADGCIQGPSRFRLALAEADWELLEECKRLVAPANKLCLNAIQPKHVQPVKALTVYSGPLVAKLTGWNVVPRKTNGLELPDVPDTLLPAFLRGFMDGDGCVGGYRVGGSDDYLQMSFYCASSSFVEAVAARVPARSSVTKSHSSGHGRQIYWSGKHAVEFGLWLYADPTLITSRRFREFNRLKVLSDTNTTIGTFGPKREEARRLFASGLIAERIAETLGVSPATICKWRKRYNWGGYPCQGS